MRAVITALCLLLATLSAQAGTKYWSGSGTWSDGGSGQWSTTSGSGYGTATWSAGDSAVFEGTPGSVTVSGSVSVSNITFTAATGGYSISGGNLTFATNAIIDQTIQHIDHTISSPISGSPSVRIYNNAGANYRGLKFTPTSGTQTLGACTLPYDAPSPAGDKGGITLGGDTSGNSVVSVDYEGGDRYSHLNKEGSGTWIVGNVRTGNLNLKAGTLILTGTCTCDYTGFIFTGGTLAGNATISETFTVPSGGVVAPGNPTGLMTIDGLTLNGTLKITVDGAETPGFSSLSVGALDISNATLTVDKISSVQGSWLEVVNYTGLTGTFATTNLPAGWEIDYAYKGNDVIAIKQASIGTLIKLQ